MILNQSATNDLVLFVNPTEVYLLVRMVHKVTCEEFLFIVEDNSPDCDFVVAEMTEPGYAGTNDAINGIMKLDSGSYDLYVYEQSSSTNLDYTLASLILEIDAYVESDEDCDRNYI